MESLVKLTELGKSLGYEGETLRDFIRDQQELEREERKLRREEEKEKLENEKEQKNFELQREREKREHEKELAKMQHDETLKHIELQREKDSKELATNASVEEMEAKMKLEELEHKHKIELLEAQSRFHIPPSPDQPRSTSARSPKLPYFDEEKDDMDAYLQRFERYATAQNWKTEQWAIHLSALLKGKALEVYSRIPPEEALKYEVLKSALIKRFEMTEDGFRKRFRNCRPEVGETFLQFAVRLTNYITRWMELSKTDKTFEGLLDLMLRDQFIQSCGKELILFLRERVPKSIEEMSTLADQFREARGGSNVNLISRIRKPELQSRVSNIPRPAQRIQTRNPSRAGIPKSEKRWFLCDGLGHYAFECRSRSGKPQKTLAMEAQAIQQDQYGKFEVARESQGNRPSRGHYRGRGSRLWRGNSRGRGQGRAEAGACGGVANQDSTTEKAVVETEGKSGVCGSCSILTPTITERTAILSSACNLQICHLPRMPICQGKVNGQVVTLLRDTGCSGVVIRRSLIKEEQLNGKTQLCILIDGTKLPALVANVHIDTPYYKGQVEAWCMDNPVYDLIVGNIEGARLPGEPDPQWKLTQAVRTRAQKKEEAKPYKKLKVPEMFHTTATPEEIKLAQQEDTTLAKIREMAQNGDEKLSKNGSKSVFVIKKGVLYRKFRSAVKASNQICCQLVVPRKFRETVMKLAHETLMSGHFSTKKTCDRIQTDFFWPGVQADVTRFCRSCDICQRTYPKGRVTKAPLGNMPLIDVPFQRIAVDLVGPLDPPTYNKNRYILTIVDYATRYPEAVPLPGIEAERLAEALVDIFSRLGVPREMLTDMGAQFTSELMSEVSRLLSIRQLTTTPYHPMCNGLVEKFNGTLKQMLKKMCYEQPKDWDKYINSLLFAYREVPQESTGFSPFELLYGRSIRGPMAILKELWTNEVPDVEVKTTYQYVFDLREKLEKSCELAQEQLRKSSKRYKHAYNRRARNRQLKEGDKVLILLPTNNNKLLMQWQGPFVITEKVGLIDYRVYVNGKIKTFHVNLLKPYVERAVVEQPNTSEQVLAVTSVAVIDLDQDEEPYPCEENDLPPPPSLVQTEFPRNVQVSTTLNVSQQKEIRDIIDQFPDVFTDVPGHTNLIEHEIKLTSNEPIRVKQYPMPYNMTEAIKEEVRQMKEMDVIEHSESPYCFPVVMIKKKDGTNRCCIDFRQLNRVTIFDSEPMPIAEEMFTKLSGHRFFSRLDLSKGYWQVPMSEKSKPLTAFSTPLGLFQFKTMPFGLVNAPTVFSRLMRKLLAEMENIDNFIDDILVFSFSWSSSDEVCFGAGMASMQMKFTSVQDVSSFLCTGSIPSKLFTLPPFLNLFGREGWWLALCL